MGRFVVFSDLHLHEWNYGSTIVDGRNSRLAQQEEIVKSIVTYCKENEIRKAFFCGDLFHTSTVTASVSQAASRAFSGFKEEGIDLTLIVGNHDQGDRTGRIHALESFRNYGRLIDTTVCPGFYEDADEAFNFLPYTDDKGRLEGWLRSCRDGFIFMHQGVGGVELNSKGFTLNEILTPDMIPVNCPMAFAGHYHSFKHVTDNLIIPGSTMQLTWADEGEPRGWLDVKTLSGRVDSITLKESGASQFCNIEEGLLANKSLPDVHGKYIRVSSAGDYSPDEITNALMEQGAVSVEIRPRVRENILAPKLAQMADFNEMVQTYAMQKERQGVIDEYDKAVGERLLRDEYRVPQV